MMRFVAAGCLLTLIAVQLDAQTTTTRPVEESRFEVASVKPLPEGSNAGGSEDTTTGFRALLGIPEMIGWAYRVREFRIVNLPGWAKTPRYSITATITAPRQKGDLVFMVRHLLSDRFQLEAHQEQRPMPIYALVLARSDGRLGPDMQRVERPCTREQITAAQIGVPDADAQCGRQEDWQSIIETIQYSADRPVIDKTGLSGYFSVTWSFNTESTAGGTAGPAGGGAMPRSLVVERLGLKLEPRTEMLDVLVIDQLARPTPD